MTATAAGRFKPYTPDERRRALILGAQVLIRQAKLLGHAVDDQVKQMAAQPLPGPDTH